jgi:hypothetical protein
MSDTPERSVEYTPEEGEVHPASRYSVAPTEYEAMARDVAGTPYQSLSVLALAAFLVAVAYSALVALGGIATFWMSKQWMLLVGSILVPLLSIPVAMKFNIRGWPGLLRVAALALLAFYAVPVGIGGLIAFPGQSPWLLSLWTLIFPLAAIAIGLAARLRIQTSEGTLTGIPLTTWAVGLSLFYALCYTAFYSATYIAVRQQAVDFTDDWIDRVQKDDLERAFMLTLDLPYRNSKSDTMSRDEIESYSLRHPSEGGQGAYAGFAEYLAVRLLSGSTKANVELVNVGNWDYETGGYKVQLTYQVTTPYWSFPLHVTVFGAESSKGDWKGRRWVLQTQASNLSRFNPTFTLKGNQLLALASSGQDFAESWTKDLWTNPGRALTDKLPGGAFAAPAATGLGLRAQQLQAPFFKGEVVKSDPKLFYVKEEELRQQLIDNVQDIFVLGRRSEGLTLQFPTLRTPLPSWKEENGRLLFRYDVDIKTPIQIPLALETLEDTKKYMPGTGMVQAHMVVSCPSTALGSDKPEWRFESLELLRGQPVMLGGPGGPGGPGPRGPGGRGPGGSPPRPGPPSGPG